MPALGTLAYKNPRDVFVREAGDFTPWLRTNIKLLGDAIGMDLDLAASEVRVGPFAADIVAKDVSRDRWVVIENQLEATDHPHLGQLLTYGAGTDASVFVWISPAFREEHRAALDWLNEHSDAQSEFFGVELELLTIDGSAPAPYFRLVSYPNDWKKGGTHTPATTTERGAAYNRFWSDLLREFNAKYPNETSVRKPPSDSWINLSIGRSGIVTGWAFTQDRRFRVELYIDTGEKHFDELHSQRSTIERELGHELIWDRLEGRRACRISSYFMPVASVSVTDSADVLQALISWGVPEMKRLRDVMRPRIAQLSPTPGLATLGNGAEHE